MRLGKWIRLLRDSRGATAIEFALVVPVLIALLGGIFELGTILLFAFVMNSATNAGVGYVQTATIHREAITKENLRKAIVASSMFNIDNKKLKISLTPISNNDIGAVVIDYPIKNKFKIGKTGEYVLAVGYDWSTILPTSRYLIPIREASRSCSRSNWRLPEYG